MATNKINHSKMSRQDRAKQFMPFAALKGYEEALRKKEIELEQKYQNQKNNFFVYKEKNME